MSREKKYVIKSNRRKKNGSHAHFTNCMIDQLTPKNKEKKKKYKYCSYKE